MKKIWISFLILGGLFLIDDVHYLLAEKNPGVDSKPCYTSQTDMGKIVQDLTRRVGELETKVNKLEHK